MEIPYQIRLESLAHLLQLLSDCVNEELMFEDTPQLSLETKQAYLTHVLKRQLEQHLVSKADQKMVLEFLSQHFSDSPVTSLVNHEDKHIIN